MIFLSEQAPLHLGVGKNMARAIDYWCHACKVLGSAPVPGQRSFMSVPTPLGEALLGEDGWDPYLEDPASLWYLHWKLVEAPSQATAWRYVFTSFSEREFTVEQLGHVLQEFVAKTYPAARAAPSSIHKDLLCIVRMYGDYASAAGGVSEESIQCPFSELGLVRQTPESKVLAFDVGEKPGLPDAIVLAACLEFASVVVPNARTIAFSRLLSDHGSPGMAFKLTEGALIGALERISARDGSIGLADTAGLVQLSFKKDPALLAREFLELHFQYSSSRVNGHV